MLFCCCDSESSPHSLIYIKGRARVNFCHASQAGNRVEITCTAENELEVVVDVQCFKFRNSLLKIPTDIIYPHNTPMIRTQDPQSLDGQAIGAATQDQDGLMRLYLCHRNDNRHINIDPNERRMIGT